MVFSDSTEDLQSLLNHLLVNKVQNATQRQQDLSVENGEFQLINKWDEVHGMIFCQFINYEKEKYQTKIELKGDCKFYNIKASDPGKNKAFAEDIFYFGVLGNHLVCMQTKSLRAKQLERYLYWLFTSATNHFGDKDTFEIKDQPEEAIYEKVMKNKVKSVKIGSPLHASIINPNWNPDIKQSTYNLTGLSSQILRAIIPDFDDLDIGSTLDEANLSMSITLRFKNKTSDSGQKLINEIASGMRHIDPDEYELLLSNGAKISGHDMKISSKVQVSYLGDGLVDEVDLYSQFSMQLLEILNKVN